MDQDKKKILLIAFISIFIVSFFVLFLQRKSVVISSSELSKPSDAVEDKKVLADMESDYQKEAKRIFGDYVDRESRNDIDLAGLKQLKNDFLALKVTERFKDVHLQIVLAMLKTEKYLTGGNIKDKNEGVVLISDIKSKNPWLD